MIMYKIIVYVPSESKETVKSALFDAGAGRIGDYACCCWEVLGQEQFLPLPNSQPYLGQEGELERVPEFRLELVCEAALIKTAVLKMIEAHPYEEPAYQVLPFLTLADL
ncbi:YqfO family protein [Sessilibacter sp. MAH1]